MVPFVSSSPAWVPWRVEEGKGRAAQPLEEAPWTEQRGPCGTGPGQGCISPTDATLAWGGASAWPLCQLLPEAAARHRTILAAPAAARPPTMVRSGQRRGKTPPVSRCQGGDKVWPPQGHKARAVSPPSSPGLAVQAGPSELYLANRFRLEIWSERRVVCARSQKAPRSPLPAWHGSLCEGPGAWDSQQGLGRRHRCPCHLQGPPALTWGVWGHGAEVGLAGREIPLSSCTHLHTRQILPTTYFCAVTGDICTLLPRGPGKE